MVSNTKGVMPEIEGKRVSELAKEWGVSEFNAYKRIVEKTGAHADVLMFKYANDEIIERLRVHPMALYMTDAWVTDQGVQNFAIYYNFPKFILLAKRTGTPIEEAINKMTGLTAERYGIKDRGIIAEGNKADITIFDIYKLSYKEQAEEAPKGIDYVFINGLPVLKDGKLIDKSAKAAGRFVKA
jgi:N-acyl-D-amino-acid deacylase